MTSFTFGKLFDGLFASVPSTHPLAASQRPVPAVQTAQVAPIPVGTGAANERHLTIAGEPMLFRDEGDVVVQFKPAFDYDLRETTVGMKLIPALTPHWEVVREFSCSVTEAIATAIKEAAGSIRNEHREPQEKRAQVFERASAKADIVIDTLVPHVEDVASKVVQPRRIERARFGVIKEWGEKTFLDGKRPGKTYESFCLTLVHRGEIHVLQGEGLRDAIADARCTMGDSVEVRRLDKIKVPAVDKQGRPKHDAQGAQVLWDKWQWSIRQKS
jgi:hypothetical protein